MEGPRFGPHPKVGLAILNGPAPPDPTLDTAQLHPGQEGIPNDQNPRHEVADPG